MKRRPPATGCNLHADRQLAEPLTRARATPVNQTYSSMRANPGGTPRAEGVFPPGVPPRGESSRWFGDPQQRIRRSAELSARDRISRDSSFLLQFANQFVDVLR